MNLKTARHWQKKVRTILEQAEKEGRQELYEHEVYKVLEAVELQTPCYRFIQKAEELDRSLLSEFGSSRVVMKIVSPQVAHKEKLGGVKVLHKDIDFIKYSFDMMCRRFRDQNIPVAGVLLVEYIEYSPELGNEVMIGFRESGSFGPVISFSKGGSDAEHFAEHFSAPNLVLPPLNREWARALLSSTDIQKKYIQDSKGDYLEQIVDAEMKFSALSTWFSHFFEGDEDFFFSDFEINPFVFDPDHKLIALDGYAVFGRKEKKITRENAPSGSLDPFFHPEGVAVVGVSASDSERPGNIIASNLLKLGRKDVYCVNPKGGTALLNNEPVQLYSDLKDLPVQTELVIVTVPAQAAPAVAARAAETGCKALLLIPGGFSESSHENSLEEEILRVCRAKGIRIMGPNCLGIVYSGSRPTEGKPGSQGINTFFIPEKKFRVDLTGNCNMALFSQSGALGLVELSQLRHAVSPKVVVSYGNQIDAGPCDLVDYWSHDPDIRVMGVYIEGFSEGEGRRFFDITSKRLKDREAAPIVVYKAGRTLEGKMATQSHTASMAGEYAVARAAMKQAGLIVADTMADHLGYIKTFAMLTDKKPRGMGCAVVTNAGYEKANAADNLGRLKLAELDESCSAALKEKLPPFVTVEPLLDLTPMVGDELFVDSIRILLESETVDCVLVSIVPHSGFLHTTDEEIQAFPQHIASGIVELNKKTDKPLIVSLTATSGLDSEYNRMGQILETGGVPVFLSAEQAMKNLEEFTRYHMIRDQNLLEEWIR
ncbi:MAG: acetate--CoA ligase family protein [Spirochaetales bacterium]|nr:acetate--CoA ligase family protein [Spirochaetales bacterium]